VKRVAQVLGVSRSQLTERLKGAAKTRSHYAKTDDAELLAPLRALVDERPTYGYRRITVSPTGILEPGPDRHLGASASSAY
jgi:putative transposase